MLVPMLVLVLLPLVLLLTSPAVPQSLASVLSCEAAPWPMRDGADAVGVLPRSARQPRIVGGSLVRSADAYSFYGALFVEDRTSGEAGERSIGTYACGASLIAPRVVLTAAHCVALVAKGGSQVTGRVLFGTDNIRNVSLDTDGVHVGTVAQHFTHPFWQENIVSSLAALKDDDGGGGASSNPFLVQSGSRGTLLTPGLSPPDEWSRNSFDFGLLILREEVPGAMARPIVLNRDADVPKPNGSTVRVVGHGKTSPDAEHISYTLREATVPIVPLDECRESFQPAGLTITPDMLCAGRGRADACYADSGSPLFTDSNGDGIFEQVGLVSWGIGCADEQYPGVYARVSAGYDWIRDVVRNRTGARV